MLNDRGDLITLPLPPGRPLAALPALTGTAPSPADGRAVYRVPRSAPAPAALDAWSAAQGVEPDGLEVRPQLAGGRLPRPGRPPPGTPSAPSPGGASR
ncbi:hypothetical protein ACFV1L_31885 [Kitasatospora sp. NPDC059646]|uniref:hypothetical protein n=1 Tax=Kitasatospora sp. NPDC059646 TaxID=3346893 RepID=UPI00368204B5